MSQRRRLLRPRGGKGGGREELRGPSSLLLGRRYIHHRASIGDGVKAAGRSERLDAVADRRYSSQATAEEQGAESQRSVFSLFTFPLDD